MTEPTHAQGDARLEILLDQVTSYDRETAQSVRLVPTEGIMSPLQKLMYLSVQHERYLHAPPEDADKAVRYPDIARLQEVYELCRDAIRHVFSAQFALPDLLSGLQAMSVAILAFSAPGETVLSVDPAHGGHPQTAEIATTLGRQSAYIPFSPGRHVIAVERLGTTASEPPALVYLDQSNALYAEDVAAIRDAFARAALVVDVSHVAALVAGGRFPNPLLARATAVVASAHKSLCGPQKAFFATNDAVAYHAALAVTKVFVSNNHPASVAALAVCLLEATRYGADYAERLLTNARTLASSLADRGLPVVSAPGRIPLTDTHQVWIDCEQLGWGAEDAVKLLSCAGIIVNTLYICVDDSTGRKGLRLGTTEVTRLGMGDQEMHTIASSISSVLVGRIAPQEQVPVMMALRGRFNEAQYCYRAADITPGTRRALHGLLRPLLCWTDVNPVG